MAGAEIEEAVPTNVRWRLLGLQATLVTDATVANRRPTVVITDDADLDLFRFRGQADQAASLTMQHVFSPQQYLAGSDGARAHYVLPPDTFLPQGWKFKTVTANIAAGDNWGAPQIWVEEWLEE